MAQEFTQDEFLKMLPELDYSNNLQPGAGGTITPQEAARKIRDYLDFLNAPGNENIKDQTHSVGFDSEKLIDWLLSQRNQMDEVQVCFAMDMPARKFTVVFVPYKDGRPSFSASPYNIGGRRP